MKCCLGRLAGGGRLPLGHGEWVLLVMGECTSQGVKGGGIAGGEMVVPCGLGRRKWGLQRLRTVRSVEMMSLIPEGHLLAVGAAEPVELEEGLLVETA